MNYVPLVVVPLALWLSACGDDTPAGRDTTSAPDATTDAAGDTGATTATTTTETDAATVADSEAEVADSAATDTSDPGDTLGDATSDTTADTDAGCTPAVCAGLAEERAALELAALAAAPDDGLDTFLRDVPKGGDLHHHLSGAIWAETYLAWAADEGGYCIDLRASSYLSLTRSCGSNTAPIPAPGDPLYDDVIAAWSMEGFDPSGGATGHDHFFATFGKFGAISGDHHGLMLADVKRRAARENQVYIELMLTSNSAARDLGDDVWARDHAGANVTEAALPGFLAALLADSGMAGAVQRILDDVSETEAIADQELGCDGPSAEPACAVTTRYQVYISRSGTQPGVFAQMVAAYEAGIDDPKVVGLNLVGPEDGVAALQRYDLQMSMLGFLNDQYRATGKSPVRLSLHAGELAAKFMPAGWQIGTIDHIRKAIEGARAERIGHGLDVQHESDPEAILEQMRDDRILVEICLSSNIQILETSGVDHPLWDYLDADVPAALATDDQGVSRSSLAGEYRRAVLDQRLDYTTLKRMARQSLEHAFLPGESLWFDLDATQPVAPCVHGADEVLGLATPPAACRDYLVANERAGLQYELERRFRLFEAARPTR